MHKAKIVLLEAAVRSAGAINRREAAQALGFQDAVDRVAIEMRQKVDHHEGQVIERKAGRTPARRRQWPALLLLLSRAAYAGGSSGPGSWLRRACATCGWSRWTRHSGGPAHPWARSNGRSRRGPPGSCGLLGGPLASGPPRPSGPGQPLKAPGVCLNRPTNLIPTMFRYQTAKPFWGRGAHPPSRRVSWLTDRYPSEGAR